MPKLQAAPKRRNIQSHNYQEFSDALTSGNPPAIIMVNANDKLFGGNGD